jgi:hypothetical protein
MANESEQISTVTAIRRPHALSGRVQRRILAMLKRRAEGGDIQAAEALVRLAILANAQAAPALLQA